MRECKLTEKQRICLRDAVDATSRGEWIDPFRYGSTTISVLKKHGFIVAGAADGHTVYRVTDAGLARLARL